MELKTLLDSHWQQQVQLLTVSIDSHEKSRELIQRLESETPGGVDFPLLEDQNHRVIDRYGLLNPEGKGWPHPATYVIDKEGIVRWKFVEVNYKVRPTNNMIFDALKTLP